MVGCHLGVGIVLAVAGTLPQIHVATVAVYE